MNPIYLAWSVLLGVLLAVPAGRAIQCSVCDTTDDGWECLSRPPTPKECGYDFCINVSKYEQTGKLASFTRSCSPFALPKACVPGQDRKSGDAVQLCYATCSTSGCNSGSSLHQLLDLLRRK